MTLQSGARREAADPIGRRIGELAPWFHNLHLPTGHQTAPDHPLGDYPAFKWRQFRSSLPDDLTGWRALDVGCNAGFYSFELARRGARVFAIDADPHYLRQAHWARSLLGLDERVELREMQVYDLARVDERFDLVLFLGVLYHLRYPLLALDLLAEKVDRLLVLQTLTLPDEEELEETWGDVPFDRRDVLLRPGWPKAAFVERNLANDPTNWWVPNHACVEAMARSAGLEIVERPGHELYVCCPAANRDDIQRRNRRELDAAAGRNPARLRATRSRD